MLTKQESSQKLPSFPIVTFGKIADSVLKKGKSAILPLFNDHELLLSASDKGKLFARSFPRNYNLDESVTSLPAFPSRTNLKL